MVIGESISALLFDDAFVKSTSSFSHQIPDCCNIHAEKSKVQVEFQDVPNAKNTYSTLLACHKYSTLQ
jgi:hypothetical protein